MSEDGVTLEIKSPALIILIIFVTLVFAMEVGITLNTPISFGDEGFHTRMAQWIGERREYPVWRPFEGSVLRRKSIGTHPFWHLLEGSIVFLIGHHEFIVKTLTPFIAVLSSLALFILTKRLYNEKIAFIASIVFLTVPSFVTYSVLFYTDVLFTFYFMMFFLTFLLYFKNHSRKYWLLSATFCALAFLTKLPGAAGFVFIGGLFIYELLYSIRKAGNLKIVKNYIIFIFLIGIICSGFLIRNLVYYKTLDCGVQFPFFEPHCKIDEFEEKYSFSGRTESVGTEASILAIGIMNYLEFAYGNLWLAIFGLIAGIILISMRKNSKDLLLLFMLSLISLPFIFYKSYYRAEDAARYTLAWMPMIAIVAAQYFEKMYLFLKKYQKYLALIVFLFILVIGYQNMKTKLDAMSQVKKFSPSFFESCDWVKENLPKDGLLFTIWSHRSVYSCQRNAVGNFADVSLSRDLNYTLSVAREHNITHIFIQKFSIDYQNRHLQEKYDWEFVKLLEDNPEHFNKVYENGPSLEQCRQVGGCDGNIIYEVNY